MQNDPKNVLAHETKGYIAFRQGQREEARKWFGEAVQLDSQSFLAHYYFAAMSLRSGGTPSEQEQVERSLRTATRLNPSFAPAFDRLAVCLAMQNKDLEEAHRTELMAITLDPSNMGYRLNIANVLMKMDKSQNAVEVLRAASKLAKNPEESQMLANAVTRAQEYADLRAKLAERKARFQASETESVTTGTGPDVPRLKRRDFVPKGPHRFAVGVLRSITCQSPELDLKLNTTGKLISLHADNYYKITISAVGFAPSQDLNPCKDLENRPAKVEYVESANPSVSAQLVSVELHK